MKSLQGELAELLRIHGPERFAHALAPLLTDQPDFVSQLQGGAIWLLTEFEVVPRRHLARRERAVHTMAEVAGLECATVRMPYARLTVGVKGARVDVNRFVEGLRLMQAKMIPRAVIEMFPSSGRWRIAPVDPNMVPSND